MRTEPAVPFIAGAAINPRRLVKFSADNTVIQATGATDATVGASDSLGAAAAGDTVMVYMSGDQVEVEAGGAITRGLPVTADADGKAVVCAPAAGTRARYAGFTSKETAASGDHALVKLAP